MAWPAGSLIEVRVHYGVNLQKCMNVFHYYNAGDSTGFTVPELTEGFAQANIGGANGTWDTEFANALAINAIVNRVDVQLVFPARWRAFETIVARAGVRGTACTAQNVQGSISKFGDMANRHNQGGMRIGAVSPGDYTGGLITGAYKTALTTLATQLMTVRVDSLTPTTYHLAIANKEPIPGTNPPKFRFSGLRPVIGLVVENEIRTQRTRTVGRGE